MGFFNDTELVPPDPILGLTVAFLEDERPNKVNLGVGAYRTDGLEPFVLDCVRKAEARLLEQGLDMEYAPVEGPRDYIEGSHRLIFGELSEELAERTFVTQSPGGTGGLRLVGELVAREMAPRIGLSTPSWVNHELIFTRSRHELHHYPYGGGDTIDSGAMLDAISKLPERTALIIQPCCHNPVGLDPDRDTWLELCEITKRLDLFPIFDFAYQGFGESVEDDAWPIRHFAREGVELAVTQSYSKNMGLYGHRVGALHVLAATPDDARRIGTQLKRTIRSFYSTPPCHGARLVGTVLSDSELTANWRAELEQMRQRIVAMRDGLAGALSEAGATLEVPSGQRGMFWLSGLSREQVDRLRDDHAIYCPSSGRLNLAGLAPGSLRQVAEAVATVG
ncbi:MAG: aromatic amino acid transaminase [Acidobacteriota bacterium]